MGILGCSTAEMKVKKYILYTTEIQYNNINIK